MDHVRTIMYGCEEWVKPSFIDITRFRKMSTLTDAPSTRLELLQRDGFCRIPRVLDAALLARLQEFSRARVAALDETHLNNQRATGTMIDSIDMPEFAELFAHPGALKELSAMGLEDVKFWKANLISKPPHSPRNYWHNDCIMWHDPRSYSSMPPMIFLMYYLVDTCRENGCLRVLPGTHRRRHPLHEMGEAHVGYINRMDQPDDPRFGDFDGEIDVPVTAGDLLIGDARLFHATHANTSDAWRPVITIWFHPFFGGLAESTQRWLTDSHHGLHGRWPDAAKQTISPITPRHSGTVEPRFTRKPDVNWK